MHQIKYKVIVQYKDFDSVVKTVSYSLFANDENDAIKIAEEFFFMNIGVCENMHFDAKAISPSKEELISINSSVLSKIPELKKVVDGKTYKDFLGVFQNFDGFNLSLSPTISSFYFTFRGFTCKAVYMNGTSFLDTEEVIFDAGNNRHYVIRANFTDIFIGV